MNGPAFNVGDKVKIVGGTFDGFGGPIIAAEEAVTSPHSVASTDAGQDGLWVAIDIFGRMVPVQQSPANLRPA